MRSPFWTLVSIRVAFWVGTALTLLWAPLHGVDIPADRAYGALGDLLFGTFEHWDAQWFLHVAQDGYNPTSRRRSSRSTRRSSTRSRRSRARTSSPGRCCRSCRRASPRAALAQIARPVLGDRGARDAVLYLALFPTAFVFTALYSDALFLALSTLSFLAASRGRAWQAGIARRARRRDAARRDRAAAGARRSCSGGAAGRSASSRSLLLPLAVVAVLASTSTSTRASATRSRGGSAQTGWQRETGTLGPLTGPLVGDPGRRPRRAADPAAPAARAGGARRLHLDRPARLLERRPPRAARRRRLADVGRVAAARDGVRPLLARDARRHPVGAVEGVPARQPAALPDGRLPDRARARGARRASGRGRARRCSSASGP